jgi:3-phosphoglycerate kinase
VAVLGGAKVSDKVFVVRTCSTSWTRVLVGGAMAYTFMKAAGIDVGSSRVRDRGGRQEGRREAGLKMAQEILDLAKAKGKTIVLPVDHVVTQKVEAGAPTKVVDADRGGLDGRRHRPEDPRALRFDIARREDRDSGTARWASSR